MNKLSFTSMFAGAAVVFSFVHDATAQPLPRRVVVRRGPVVAPILRRPVVVVPAPRVVAPAPAGPVAVQRALSRHGYYNGPIDGIVGPGTSSAIAAWQRANDLRPTGDINGPTLRSLGL